MKRKTQNKLLLDAPSYCYAMLICSWLYIGEWRCMAGLWYEYIVGCKERSIFYRLNVVN